MKLAYAVFALLAAQSLGAKDVSVHVGATAISIPVPADLEAGDLTQPGVRNFSWSFSYKQEVLAFMGTARELAASSSKMPAFRRFVVVLHPATMYNGSLTPGEFVQRFQHKTTQGAIRPVLESWSQASPKQRGIYDDVMRGTSLLTTAGEGYDIDIILNTETATGSASYQNLEGKAFYPKRCFAVTSRSHCLAGGKLIEVDVFSELSGPEDIDWVIATTRAICTQVAAIGS